jgi:hypothetical protein
MKSILHTLSSALPRDATIDDLKRVLADLFGADDVSVFDSYEKRQVRRDEILSDVMRTCDLEIRATFQSSQPAHQEVESSEPEYGNAADDFDDVMAPRATIGGGGGGDRVEERVIREIYSRERNRKFVWAGYVVKTILPTLGVEQHAAQSILDKMVKDEVLLLVKKPNPRNPDFPTTSVQLNHDNRTVRRIVNDAQSRNYQPAPTREDSYNSSDY